MEYLDQKYAGSLDRMFAQPTAQLRNELLALNGVGPETADSILLYAGNHPVFVVDAYTRRILERHGLITAATKYEEIRAMMENAIRSATPDSHRRSQSRMIPRHKPSRISRMRRTELAQHYNELHALIVRAGNQFCRSSPLCTSCPLHPFLTSPLKQQPSTETNRNSR